MNESLRERSEARIRLLTVIDELNKLPEPPTFEAAVIRLIGVANTRTKGGDKSGSGREMFIKAGKQKLLIRVRDDRVTEGDTGDMSTGLYVFGLSTDSDIDIEERDFVFTLPRDILYIDEPKIEEIEAKLSIDRLENVTAAIADGDKITKDQFYKQHQDHLKKLSASRQKETK